VSIIQENVFCGLMFESSNASLIYIDKYASPPIAVTNELVSREFEPFYGVSHKKICS